MLAEMMGVGEEGRPAEKAGSEPNNKQVIRKRKSRAKMEPVRGRIADCAASLVCSENEDNWNHLLFDADETYPRDEAPCLAGRIRDCDDPEVQAEADFIIGLLNEEDSRHGLPVIPNETAALRRYFFHVAQGDFSPREGDSEGDVFMNALHRDAIASGIMDMVGMPVVGNSSADPCDEPDRDEYGFDAEDDDDQDEAWEHSHRDD